MSYPKEKKRKTFTLSDFARKEINLLAKQRSIPTDQPQGQQQDSVIPQKKFNINDLTRDSVPENNVMTNPGINRPNVYLGGDDFNQRLRTIPTERNIQENTIGRTAYNNDELTPVPTNVNRSGLGRNINYKNPEFTQGSRTRPFQSVIEGFTGNVLKNPVNATINAVGNTLDAGADYLKKNLPKSLQPKLLKDYNNPLDFFVADAIRETENKRPEDTYLDVIANNYSQARVLDIFKALGIDKSKADLYRDELRLEKLSPEKKLVGEAANLAGVLGKFGTISKYIAEPLTDKIIHSKFFERQLRGFAEKYGYDLAAKMIPVTQKVIRENITFASPSVLEGLTDVSNGKMDFEQYTKNVLSSIGLATAFSLNKYDRETENFFNNLDNILKKDTGLYNKAIETYKNEYFKKFAKGTLYDATVPGLTTQALNVALGDDVDPEQFGKDALLFTLFRTLKYKHPKKVKPEDLGYKQPEQPDENIPKQPEQPIKPTPGEAKNKEIIPEIKPKGQTISADPYAEIEFKKELNRVNADFREKKNKEIIPEITNPALVNTLSKVVKNKVDSLNEAIKDHNSQFEVEKPKEKPKSDIRISQLEDINNQINSLIQTKGNPKRIEKLKEQRDILEKSITDNPIELVEQISDTEENGKEYVNNNTETVNKTEPEQVKKEEVVENVPEVNLESPKITLEPESKLKEDNTEKFIKDELKRFEKEKTDLLSKAKKSREKGQEEIAQIYEGQAKEYTNIDTEDYAKSVRKNPKYYIDSNVDSLLRYQNRVTNLNLKPSNKKIEAKPEKSSEKEKSDKSVENKEDKISSDRKIIDVPLTELSTDESRFQNRDNKFSEESVIRIIENFDERKLQPIVVWTDPANNKKYILSGHSRTEALRRLNKETIPAEEFKGTESEAIEYAKNSNSLSTPETLLERAKYYAELRKQGKDEKDIKKEAKQNENDNSRSIIALSFLNPNGKTIDGYKKLIKSTDVKTKGNIETIAVWIGEARKENPQLTNQHENEMFEYLMDNKNYENIRNKTFWLDRIGKKVLDAYFNPDEPLNLKDAIVKSPSDIAKENELKSLANEKLEQLNLLNKRENALLDMGKVKGENDFNNDPQIEQIKKVIKRIEADIIKIRQRNTGGDLLMFEPGVPYGEKQTETPAFKKWFGNSKMVYADGSPIIAFHGTNRKFNTFRDDVGTSHDMGYYGKGFYFTFTSDPNWEKYSAGEAGYYGDTIMPVYLKIEKPFDISSLSNYKGKRINYISAETYVFLSNIAKEFPELADNIFIKKRTYNGNSYDITDVPISVLPELIEKYKKLLKVEIVDKGKESEFKAGYVNTEEREFTNSKGEQQKYTSHDWLHSRFKPSYLMSGGRGEYISDEEIEILFIIDAIEKYDGLNVDYHPEGYMTRHPEITEAIKKKGYDGIVQTMDGDEAVVFEPTQIKSAIGNNGNFDSNNPSILSEKSLATQKQIDKIDKQLDFWESKENQNDISNYKTEEGEEIRFISASSGTDNNPFSEPKTIPFRKLQQGEQTTVERTFQENKHFNFFSRTTKIKSPEDVAFLFRQLESASIEHAFVLHESKDGNFYVQHLSTGTTSATIIDPKIVYLAAKEFNSKAITVVHNHPSGEVKPSDEDIKYLDRLDDAFRHTNIEVKDGIILNLLDGKYSTFRGDHTKTGNARGEKKIPVKTYSFDKLEFADDVILDKTQIISHQDIGKFLSKSRFGIGSKYQVFALNSQNRVVARLNITEPVFNEYGTTNNKFLDAVFHPALKFGANSVILVSNEANVNKTIAERLYSKGKQLNIPLLDIVSVEPSDTVKGNYTNIKSNRNLFISDKISEYGQGKNIGDLEIRLRKLKERRDWLVNRINDLEEEIPDKSVKTLKNEDYQPDMFGNTSQQQTLEMEYIVDENKEYLRKYTKELSAIDEQLKIVSKDIDMLRNKKIERDNNQLFVFDSGSKKYIPDATQEKQQSAVKKEVSEGLAKAVDGFRRSVDQIKKILAPSARSEESQTTAQVMTEKFAKAERKRAIAEESFRELSKLFDKQSNKKNLELINAIETGKELTDPNERYFANMMRDMLDKEYAKVMKRKGTSHFIENYFPHIWERGQQDAAKKIFARRPLEGSKSFLKHRTIPTTKEGIDAGLIPVSYNPVELTLLKLHEIRKFNTAHEILDELKARGMVKFIPVDYNAPAGWKKIDDKIGVIYGDPNTYAQEHIDKLQYEALEKLAEDIGVIHTRKAKLGGKMLGVAYPELSIVETKYATPEDILAHEIGHQLDFKFGLWNYLTGNIHVEGRNKTDTEKRTRQLRVKIHKEIRAIADLRAENQKISKSYKAYLRNRDEKMAAVLQAYIHVPEKMKNVAPTIFANFEEFINSNPVLKQIKNIKPSIVPEGLDMKFEKKGILTVGNYYMPDTAADVINNHLSPGYRGKVFYDMFRQLSNTMNQVQLGMSLFHATFTSIDANISKVALGLQKITEGKPLKGLFDIATSPFAFVTNPIHGSQFRKDYIKENPDNPALIDAIERAGGRIAMDTFYFNDLWKTVKKNFKQQKYIAGTAKVPFAMFEQLSKPVLEYLVPRQKLGVFSDLARNILENEQKEIDNLGTADAYTVEKELIKQKYTKLLQEAWRSVDNRLGQLVYDNLYWNRKVKDIAMIMVRSVGWNLGTFRELGGVVVDIPKLISEKRLSPRTAYTLALPIVAGLIGLVYNYLNGEEPENVKDLYFPKTGKINIDGTPDRIAVPSYVKDIYSYKENPLRTLSHKVHPAVSTLIDILNNHDYYGTEISEAVPFSPEWFADEATYIVKQFRPFTVSNIVEMNKQGEDHGKQLQSFFGFQLAQAYIRRSNVQNEIYETFQKRYGGGITSQETAETNKLKSELKDLLRNDPDSYEIESEKALKEGKLTERQLNSIEDTTPSDIKLFKRLPAEDKLKIWEKMNQKEKDRYMEGLNNEIRETLKLPLKPKNRKKQRK